uniref:Putative secretory peptide-51 n=1 Tax=Pleurobrachia bachei TaxID=34499 RepID=M4H267_PLEBA|nr:putative secretory peptide-51 [Pleurobrachia bachei]|eukprot:sb/3470341/
MLSSFAIGFFPTRLVLAQLIAIGPPQWAILTTGDWIAVKIPWDLEATPLQIKTNSTLGSVDLIYVNMYDKDGSKIGFVIVKFSSPMQYNIGYCSDWTDLPVQPPVEVEKIWTITKTETVLIIACNNVEVLNYLFADSSNNKCVLQWDGDVVEIMFRDDTASDFYRAGNVTYRIAVLQQYSRLIIIIIHNKSFCIPPRQNRASKLNFD